MTECFKVRGISSTQKFVLVALADNANDQGECFPSVSMLMEKCNLSDRAVQKSLVELIEQGHISREMRAGRSTIYLLHPRTTFTPEQYSPPNDVHPTPERGSPPPPNDVHPTPERGSPITIKEPSSEPSRNHQRALIDFEMPGWLSADAWEMWDDFRKRKGGKGWTDAGKKLSLRTLTKLRGEGHDPVALIEQSIERGWTTFYPLKDQPKAASSSGDWWTKAGFDKRWEAENSGCTETNAWLWREGRPTKKLAGVSIDPWEAVNERG
ncbi:helix-turn-helix domain-containing protein [Cupriavidus oxalaticus]